MKKSLFFGIPFALIALMLFMGCPQSADDDNSSGGGEKSAYETDVESIAIAFADGASLVHLREDLVIGNQELVIPNGKILDLARFDVTIGNITSTDGKVGKIIVAWDGGIRFGTQNVELYKSAGILIATPGFIGTNVEYILKDDDGNPKAPVDDTKRIKAWAHQVIPIVSLNISSNEAWTSYISKYTTDYPGQPVYIPISFAGAIDDSAAKYINYWGPGRLLYLIGDVTITGGINLTGPVHLPTDEGAGVGNLYNAIPDNKGSLLISGNVTLDGPNAVVETVGGFTVLGQIVSTGNRGDSNYINKTGPLVAYYVDLPSGGANFGGDVYLIGQSPSNLYTSATFDKNLNARGKVIITEVTVGKGGTLTLNGGVEFKGSAEKIHIGEAALQLAGNIVINNKDTPFDYNALVENIIPSDGVLPQLIYQQDYADAPKGGSFTIPVTFNKGATFTSAKTGGTIGFLQGATFNGQLAFGTDVSGTFSATETTAFGLPVELKSVYYYNDSKPGFGGTVLFTAKPTISMENIDFAAPVTFNSGLVLSKSGSFSNSVTLLGDLILPADKKVYLKSGAGITAPGIELNSAAATDNYGFLKAAAKGEVKISNGKLTVKGGQLAVGSVSIVIKESGAVEIDDSAGGDKIGIELGQSGTLTTGIYKLVGTEASSGTYSLLQGSGGVITFAKSKISSAANTASLIFAGTAASLPYIAMDVSGQLEIAAVTVKLYSSNETAPNANVGTVTVSGDNKPVIVLKGGGVNTTAGIIQYAATDRIVGGDVNPTTPAADTATVTDGYILGREAGSLVTGEKAGTLAYSGTQFSGTIGYYTTPSTSLNMIIGSAAAYNTAITFPVTVANVAEAQTLVIRSSSDDENKVPSKSGGIVTGTLSGFTGGSLAVFKATN
jgi:hypothetical protein